jgi:hypothetical protein
MPISMRRNWVWGLGLPVLLFSTPVAGQQRDTSDGRPDCSKMTVPNRTALSANEYRIALEKVRYCPTRASGILIAAWENRSLDSAGIAAVGAASTYNRSPELLNALLRIGADRARSEAVRLEAFTVLISYTDPKRAAIISPQLRHDPRKKALWVSIGTVSHARAGPRLANADERVLEMLDLVAKKEPSTTVGEAAGLLSEQLKGMQKAALEMREGTSTTLR